MFKRHLSTLHILQVYNLSLRKQSTCGSNRKATAVVILTSPSLSLSLSQAVCVKEVAPELQSCQLLPGLPSVIQCKADVTVSLDPMDCTST